MDILLISEYFPPDQGGASTRISILFNELIKRHHVTVITCSPHYPKATKSDLTFFRPIKRIRVKGALIIRLWIPAVSISSPIGRMINYCWFTGIFLVGLPFVESKPDIAWSTSPNFFCGFTARLAKLYFRCKALMNIDDVWPEAPIELGFLQKKSMIWLAKQAAMRAYNRKLDGFTPISDTIGLFYRHRYRLQNFFTIPVGIEDNRIKNIIQISQQAQRNRGSRPKDAPIHLMYSGVLGPAYDFTLLLKAVKLLSENYPLRLTIRGNGPLKGYLENKIASLGVKNVMLETEYLSIEALNAKLNSADIFVLPMKDNFISKTALPTKLFEYMGSGKPIVVYGTGEPQNLVENANAGVVCPNGGARDLATTIEQLIREESKWQELGKNGLKYILTHYSSSNVGNYVEGMLTQLMAESTYLKRVHSLPSVDLKPILLNSPIKR
jgi:glycosyltransferase involved in cell wall biosynthesis